MQTLQHVKQQFWLVSKMVPGPVEHEAFRPEEESVKHNNIVLNLFL